MDYYAGIDVSLKESSVCVVDARGQVVREVKVASEPECLIGYFDELDLPVVRIGLEAGPLSQWLHAALVASGREVVLLETRHVKAALSAMTVKTDRKDARGIAQLLRMGWYRPVHAKSSPAQDTRALLVGRKLLQGKLLDVELSIRGILRGYGLKVGEVSRGRCLPEIDDDPRRRGAGCPDLSIGRGRPDPVWEIKYGRRLFRAHAKEISIGRNGSRWRRQQGRRRDGADGPVRSGAYHVDASDALFQPEALGT